MFSTVSTKTSNNKTCKLCNRHTSKKDAIQCQGPCKDWMHFKCLNINPEKIKEIQTGAIRIICPCPNCDPNAKEIRLDEGYNCTNEDCVANKPINPDGTINENVQATTEARKRWPVATCGKDCKMYNDHQPVVPSCKYCNTFDDSKSKATGEGKTDLDIAQIEVMCKKVRVITKVINDVAENMKKEIEESKHKKGSL